MEYDTFLLTHVLSIPVKTHQQQLVITKTTYSSHFLKISPVRDWQSTSPASQVLPSSKSHDTKTRKDIKNPAWTNL